MKPYTINEHLRDLGGIEYTPETLKAAMVVTHGSVTTFCRRNGFNYCQIKSAISEGGNPQLKTIKKIAKALGVNLYIKF